MLQKVALIKILKESGIISLRFIAITLFSISALHLIIGNFTLKLLWETALFAGATGAMIFIVIAILKLIYNKPQD